MKHFNKRLQPTKIQLLAALLDPFLANNTELFEEIQRRFKDTSRSDLIVEYIRKYNLASDDDDEDVNADAEAATSGTQAKSATMTNRQRLLGDFAPPTQQGADALPVRRPLTMEIEEYFDAAKQSSLETELLKWWAMNEMKFPTIAKLARMVLAIPGTSAAPESAFSISACVITAKRSRISPFRASQVLFIHDNFEIVQKFQLA